MVVDSRDTEEGIHNAENWDREAVDDNGKKNKPVNDCEWLVLGWDYLLPGCLAVAYLVSWRLLSC